MNIHNFGISDEAVRIAIAEIAVTSAPLNMLYNLHNIFRYATNLKPNPQYKLFLFKVLTYGLLQEDVDSLTRFKDFKKFGPLLENGLSDKENEVILGQMDVLSFFEGCTERFENSMPTDIKEISPCEQALKYRNKQISYPLMGTFISEAIDADYQEAYQSLAEKGVTLRLPSILPAKWMRDATKDAKIENAPKFLSFFENFKKALKDKDTGLMQIYLLTALSLDKCEGISAERKLELLSNACNQPRGKLQEVLEGLSYLYSFSMRGQIKILNTLNTTRGFIASCNPAFKEMLTEDPLIHIANIPDFVDLYRDSFDHTRVPLALEIYKAKIATLGDESVTAVLERFVHSVLALIHKLLQMKRSFFLTIGKISCLQGRKYRGAASG